MPLLNTLTPLFEAMGRGRDGYTEYGNARKRILRSSARV